MIRLYRILLRAYPRWFRDRYEAELIAAFEAERTARRGLRAAGALRFSVSILADLVMSASRVRLTMQRTPGQNEPRRRSMETLVQDMRHACRGLARQPGFAAVAVLSLAIGIGGNALIFALVDGFVLHPFAYPDADRVVGIGVTFPRVSNAETFVEALSPAEYFDIRQSRTIRDLAAFDLGNRNISGGDRAERVFTGLALTDPFPPFGIRPALGRGFTAEELAPNGPGAAILSYRIWQSRFGGDQSIVGRAIRVNGRPMTVVGVMPRELLILGADLWIPWGADPLSLPRNVRQFTLVGRLAAGATLDEANRELATIARSVAQAHAAELPEYDGWRIAATPWHQALMRDARPAAILLLGAVGFVLLIACANLSNLLLARSTTRQREIAVRVALGAGRGRIARHLLIEVAVLATAGTLVGLALAYAGLPALTMLIPAQLESLGLEAALSVRVLAWTAAFAIGATVIVALLPVLQSTRTDPHDALKGEARGATSGRSPRRLRHALIVAELALSVMLLAGAGLLMRSFVKLRSVDPGIDATNVLTMRLTLPRERYQGAAINTFFQQLVDRVADTPGVGSASVASQFPPLGPFTSQFTLIGRDRSGATLPSALMTVVSDSHFAALGIPVVAGRTLTRQDGAGAPRVAVLNQAFVSRFLQGSDPIGQRISLGGPNRQSPPIEIVGIVGDTRNQGVTLPTSPEIFVPLHQTLNNQLFLMVRTETEAAAMLDPVRRQIAALDPEQPVYMIQTLEDAFSAAAFQQRLSMILLGAFALIAVSLAAVGIYGVMSYTVSTRTQEIGIRIAIGAGQRDVVWLVLAQVLRLAAAGLAIGFALVLAAGSVLRRVLFEVQPTDPAILIAVALVLGSVAVLAGWWPAWRASRIDPVEALRNE